MRVVLAAHDNRLARHMLYHTLSKKLNRLKLNYTRNWVQLQPSTVLYSNEAAAGVRAPIQPAAWQADSWHCLNAEAAAGWRTAK